MTILLLFQEKVSSGKGLKKKGSAASAKKSEDVRLFFMFILVYNL